MAGGPALTFGPLHVAWFAYPPNGVRPRSSSDGSRCLNRCGILRSDDYFSNHEFDVRDQVYRTHSNGRITDDHRPGQSSTPKPSPTPVR